MPTKFQMETQNKEMVRYRRTQKTYLFTLSEIISQGIYSKKKLKIKYKKEEDVGYNKLWKAEENSSYSKSY